MENRTYRYDLEMDAPLGKRHGNLELMVCDNILNGYLTMLTRTTPIQGEISADNKLSFCGELITLMQTLPYQAEGFMRRSGIDLVISTEQGNYPVSGILTEAQRR